ncbi:hypothetical protein FHG87_010763 [Trinorchestia longiramus]|nr:hypothetical protein FHG87_010763 [Trinorchestia longiramus]
MNSSETLVLPCKRKLQYITSSIDKDQVLRETFDKVQTLQQKNVFLLVDEVQIRPTVSISGSDSGSDSVGDSGSGSDLDSDSNSDSDSESNSNSDPYSHSY